ncbi:hypothetical protein ACN4EK_03765 [Pantanalinema rosaneae CENA516]|uniref:type II toxin-antitoxin system RelN family antitoxin n=1 Tax=Pantanalinema rosaneae TaxID=1620701 RepID=UPI003D6FE8D3
MRAIETTGTVNEQGQLCLDHPLNVAETQRVRVIVLLTESEGLEDEADEPKESVLEGFRQAWKEAQAGQTIPLEQSWDGIDV